MDHSQSDSTQPATPLTSLGLENLFLDELISPPPTAGQPQEYTVDDLRPGVLEEPVSD